MADRLALSAQSVVKSYGSVRALRGVDLEVEQGQIFGFLGPNGAGKTTTIRCMLDMIRPDSGELRVLGLDPQTDPVAVHARTGYLSGELRLDDNLTGERELRYLTDLRGGQGDWTFVRQLAARLDLDLKRPIRNLSKGNKQKIGIIQALMHRAELLLLDEPTSGLDPLMQQEVLALIREANDQGASVFFCSHIMSEVQSIAERVAIIRQGRVAEVADTDDLINRAVRHATVRFREPVDLERLMAVPGVSLLWQDDSQRVRLKVEGEMDTLIKALAQLPVSDLETSRPSLEEVFLAYYEADSAASEEAQDVDHL